MKAGRAILALNAGSSTLKYALYVLRAGALMRQGGGVQEGPDHDVAAVLAWAEARAGGLAAVGHRVVHGRDRFIAPTMITGPVLDALENLTPFAPLHQPACLALVRSIATARPGLTQVACFDTAFHQGHAPEVDRLPLPREWEARGMRRYGFHGLSYDYVSRRLAELDPALAAGRLVLAHLGAGASLCAVHGRRSVDTTMGFSTLDGLVMATRPGALDAGAVLHLIRREGLSPEAVEDMLYRRSGLLGLSGLSGDMRILLASDAPEARGALDVYILQIVRQVGALAAVLGGLDGLVFTGGVGERAPEIRAKVCARLAWLGAVLSPGANEANLEVLEASSSRIALRIIPTDEERMIAEQCAARVVGPAVVSRSNC